MRKKLKLVFDATILANEVNKDAARSGIYFTAFNIFKELTKHKEIDLILCNWGANYEDLSTFLNKYFKNIKFNIINANSFTLYKKLKKRKDYYKNNGNLIVKFLIQILLCCLSPISKIWNKFVIFNCIKKVNMNDAYLSLIYKKPQNLKIKSYTMLYDLTPKLFPDYHIQIFKKGDWLYDLCHSLNKNDYYFAISNATRNDFLKYYPCIDEKKIKTTYLACNSSFKPKSEYEIDIVKKKYNIPNNKKYVFSLCTLEPRKNLIRAVKTFVEFINKNNIDDLVFVLGGGHWNYFIEKLEQEIKNLSDCRDKIIKIGYVDDEDLPALYSGAEWFTYTSMYEGFGLPPLEAMSCGCSVITSNNSSLPEVVGNAAIMIDWDSDEQHIQAYEKYYFDNGLRMLNRTKGLERAKQFSWEKCTNEILRVIKNEHV